MHQLFISTTSEITSPDPQLHFSGSSAWNPRCLQSFDSQGHLVCAKAISLFVFPAFPYQCHQFRQEAKEKQKSNNQMGRTKDQKG